MFTLSFTICASSLLFIWSWFLCLCITDSVYLFIYFGWILHFFPMNSCFRFFLWKEPKRVWFFGYCAFVYELVKNAHVKSAIFSLFWASIHLTMVFFVLDDLIFQNAIPKPTEFFIRRHFCSVYVYRCFRLALRKINWLVAVANYGFEQCFFLSFFHFDTSIFDQFIFLASTKNTLMFGHTDENE